MSIDKSKCRVKVSKDGPYIVTGRVPLGQISILWDERAEEAAWGELKPIPTKGNYSLCRCGASGNKPFCDKSHVKARFDGTERAGLSNYSTIAKKIEGKTVDLFDAEGLCASARFCRKGGGIWKLVRESDDQVKRALVIMEGKDCPSGRLVVRDRKTDEVLEPALEPSIVAIEDPSIGVSGPLWVRGGIIVESADGKAYEARNRVTLCRCGKSGNKPFCDSSHWPE